MVESAQQDPYGASRPSPLISLSLQRSSLALLSALTISNKLTGEKEMAGHALHRSRHEQVLPGPHRGAVLRRRTAGGDAGGAAGHVDLPSEHA